MVCYDNKECSQFLWDGKRPKVRSEICCLPKIDGGLATKKSEDILKAKRIKFAIHTLKHLGDPWTMSPAGHFSCLDNGMSESFYVLRADETPSLSKIKIPKFYQDCILSIQELNQKGRHSTNTMLWGNHNLKFNGSVLEFPHWAIRGIRRIGEIYQNGGILERQILQQLAGNARANFFSDIAKMRNAITNTDITNEHTRITADLNILNMEFKIQKDKTIKKLGELEFRDIIQILNQTNHDHTWTNKVYWNIKLANTSFEPERIFEDIFCDKFTPRKPRNFVWKLFYGQVNVEKKLKIMKMSDGICKICQAHEEDFLLKNPLRVKHF